MTTILDRPVIEDITVEEQLPEKCNFDNCAEKAKYIIVLNRPCDCGRKRLLVCLSHRMFVVDSSWMKCYYCRIKITIKDIWTLK